MEKMYLVVLLLQVLVHVIFQIVSKELHGKVVLTQRGTVIELGYVIIMEFVDL